MSQFSTHCCPKPRGNYEVRAPMQPIKSFYRVLQEHCRQERKAEVLCTITADSQALLTSCNDKAVIFSITATMSPLSNNFLQTGLEKLVFMLKQEKDKEPCSYIRDLLFLLALTNKDGYKT